MKCASCCSISSNLHSVVILYCADFPFCNITYKLLDIPYCADFQFRSFASSCHICNSSCKLCSYAAFLVQSRSCAIRCNSCLAARKQVVQLVAWISVKGLAGQLDILNVLKLASAKLGEGRMDPVCKGHSHQVSEHDFAFYLCENVYSSLQSFRGCRGNIQIAWPGFRNCKLGRCM